VAEGEHQRREGGPDQEICTLSGDRGVPPGFHQDPSAVSTRLVRPVVDDLDVFPGQRHVGSPRASAQHGCFSVDHHLYVEDVDEAS
jgi:hypothetical protein